MSYSIKEISLDMTKNIYDEYINEYFPKGEVKPFSHIERMWNDGCYSALALYDDENDKVAGFAFFANSKESRHILLDYLAVVKEYRCMGLGGIFLNGMREYVKGYEGILIETEDVDMAENEEQLNERTRRNAFYKGNNAQQTGIHACVYGVDYSIWNVPLDKETDVKKCCESLQDIYKEIAPGKRYEEHVEISY